MLEGEDAIHYVGSDQGSEKQKMCILDYLISTVLDEMQWVSYTKGTPARFFRGVATAQDGTLQLFAS